MIPVPGAEELLTPETDLLVEKKTFPIFANKSIFLSKNLKVLDSQTVQEHIKVLQMAQ